jgi:hypothetical protein
MLQKIGMAFGIWNVRFTGKTCKRISRVHVGLVGVQVRVDEDGTEPAAFLCSNERENQFSMA